MRIIEKKLYDYNILSDQSLLLWYVWPGPVVQSVANLIADPGEVSSIPASPDTFV